MVVGYFGSKFSAMQRSMTAWSWTVKMRLLQDLSTTLPALRVPSRFEARFLQQCGIAKLVGLRGESQIWRNIKDVIASAFQAIRSKTVLVLYGFSALGQVGLIRFGCAHSIQISSARRGQIALAFSSTPIRTSVFYPEERIREDPRNATCGMHVHSL